MQVMEQETYFSEKSSFANQNYGYKKYGTTNQNNTKRNQQQEVLVRHNLSKSDTLQGIAIQYGCSVSFFLCVPNSMKFSNLVTTTAILLALSCVMWWLTLLLFIIYYHTISLS